MTIGKKKIPHNSLANAICTPVSDPFPSRDDYKQYPCNLPTSCLSAFSGYENMLSLGWSICWRLDTQSNLQPLSNGSWWKSTLEYVPFSGTVLRYSSHSISQCPRETEPQLTIVATLSWLTSLLTCLLFLTNPHSLSVFPGINVNCLYKVANSASKSVFEGIKA